MIEIFKTNITKRALSKKVTKHLLEIFPNASINIDLEDCDKILRVENSAQNFAPQQIIESVKEMGFECEVLNG